MADLTPTAAASHRFFDLMISDDRNFRDAMVSGSQSEIEEQLRAKLYTPLGLAGAELETAVQQTREAIMALRDPSNPDYWRRTHELWQALDPGVPPITITFTC